MMRKGILSTVESRGRKQWAHFCGLCSREPPAKQERKRMDSRCSREPPPNKNGIQRSPWFRPSNFQVTTFLGVQIPTSHTYASRSAGMSPKAWFSSRCSPYLYHGLPMFGFVFVVETSERRNGTRPVATNMWRLQADRTPWYVPRVHPAGTNSVHPILNLRPCKGMCNPKGVGGGPKKGQIIQSWYLISLGSMFSSETRPKISIRTCSKPNP